MDEFWNEVIEEYVSECTEMLEEMEHQLLSSDKLDQRLASELFRPLHSFKGSSASIGLATLAKVTHAAENLLSFFNKGNFQSADRKYIQFFLFFSDYMKLSFDRVLVDKNDSNCNSGSDDIIVLAQELINEIQNGAKESRPDLPDNQFDDATKKSISIVLDSTEEHNKVNAEATQNSNDIIPSHTASSIESAPVCLKTEIKNVSNLLDSDLLNSFIGETLELFTIAEQKLLSLINSPDDVDALREVFRHLHSFKGNCGIFAFSDLEEIGHLLETILDGLISGVVERNRNVFEVIISMLDVLQGTLGQVQNGGDHHVDGIDLYRDMLVAFIPEKNNQTESTGKLADTSSVQTPGKKVISQQIADSIPSKNKSDDIANSKRQDIRVDIKKLDILNDLVGELVTVKTMVHENLRHQSEWEHSEKTFRLLDRIATDLQDVSMSIRMVPVGGLFKKMIRIVHDLSAKLGKKVDFSYIGEDTEIDKTIIEKIGDPLVHMIRNALDHGVESAEQRIQAGKNPCGSIVLEAKNEGGEIWIVIRDDGKGINREAILKKAQSLNLLERPPESYSDQEVFSMIFLPSFSTAEKVTDVSGRGVGMDVVRKNIDEIKGRIEIDSRLGHGTIFTIKIPLTLAIIQGMMVRVGKNSFILPIETVSESVVIEPSMLTHPMGSNEMVRIRDSVLPVLSLGKIFNLKSKIHETSDGVLILAEAHGKKLALLVDQLVGQREAVVKPIPNMFRHVKGISGCSIMGDGEMSLILDIGGLVDICKRAES